MTRWWLSRTSILLLSGTSHSLPLKSKLYTLLFTSILILIPTFNFQDHLWSSYILIKCSSFANHINSGEHANCILFLNGCFCRHYLVIPIQHIPTVKNLQRGDEHFSLGNVNVTWNLIDASSSISILDFNYVLILFSFSPVTQMLNVGKTLLQLEASQSNVHRYCFAYATVFTFFTYSTNW